MKRHRKNKYLYLIIVFVLFTCIGIGYAVLSSSLSITGTVPVSANTWDIHFENVRINSGSVSTYSTPTITGSTSLSTAVTLTYPGDQYEFYVDVVNSGSIDARLDSFSKTSLSTAQQKYLSYDVYYAYNEPIKQFDLLKAGSKETLRIVIKYNSDTSLAPTATQNIGLSLSLNYVQDTGEGIERAKLCHRATTLHTGKTADGNTNLTFGQLGTKGTLQAGDAFDCDVNGDGKYDATTERFYYITDLDSDTAVLIYYSNTNASGSSISQRTPYYYSIDASTHINHKGPEMAANYLPTASVWKRVGLKNSKRQLTNESGGTTVSVAKQTAIIYDLPVFEYQTSSRLITYQEYNSISSSSNPYYLYENTPYTNVSGAIYYWLETPQSAGGGSVWAQNTSVRSTYPVYPNDASSFGVRPVIEVFKADMIY